MLGQVFLRGWVVALLCLSNLCLPSRANAVQMPDPTVFVSRTTTIVNQTLLRSPSVNVEELWNASRIVGYSLNFRC
jgi:hypothetical protein